jgi:hypothetical protein
MFHFLSGIPFVTDLKTRDCAAAGIISEGGNALSVTIVSRNRF